MEMCKEEKAKFFTVAAPQLCVEAALKQRASEPIDPFHLPSPTPSVSNDSDGVSYKSGLAACVILDWLVKA